MALRTPSSFAVLGLLEIRSWSPYELVAHLQRSTIRFIWPRAQSKLYEEPKRLLERGWARSRPDGRKTSYSISPEGRRALRRWLAEPGGGVTVESEAMLKVLFADAGTKEDLLATIRSVREEMLASQDAVLRRNAQGFVDPGPSFPERAHVAALVGNFISRVHDAILEWTYWAEDRVSGWSDVTGSKERTDEAVADAKEWLHAHRVHGCAS